MRKFLLLILTAIALQACSSTEQNSLDKAIPRMQSPVDQIAYFRTKWYDGRHIETVFYDHQGRVLEAFWFGLSSVKELHFYEGNLQKKSIYHYHSDSSAPGYVSVETVNREFDANGRLVLESHIQSEIPDRKIAPYRNSYKRHLSYSAAGDTIARLEGKFEKGQGPLADIDRWERDDKNRLSRHYRLYVMDPADHPDTVYHFTQRFAYDTIGRLELAWYDSIYLGELYIVPGPDTVWYRYNAQNQLSEEEHRYTNDMRNKREIDTTRLTSQASESFNIRRQSFITNSYGQANQTHLIKYKYEKFHPSKHQKLAIPMH